MPQQKNERDHNPDARKNQPTGTRREDDRPGGDAARTKANRPEDSTKKQTLAGKPGEKGIQR